MCHNPLQLLPEHVCLCALEVSCAPSGGNGLRIAKCQAGPFGGTGWKGHAVSLLGELSVGLSWPSVWWEPSEKSARQGRTPG